jgi:glycosyltransferase involved in cell wall biosynthesis
VKVLLSAFACEPNLGSEPEVGWKWAVHLAALGHDVWVLTREDSRGAIEREVARLTHRSPRFVYLDLPLPAALRATAGPWAQRIYYALWQWRAALLAGELHAREGFERVHHVTYAGLRAPSFMGRLGIPFIFGPVGGGERAPWRLRSGYGLRGWLLDAVRDFANLIVRIDPLMQRCFAQAERIYVTSEDSLRLLPPAHRGKAVIELAIGSDSAPAVKSELSNSGGDGRFRVLYVGQFLYLKGMHLGLPAFSQLLKAVPEARLTMIGEGPERGRWQQLAERLGIAASIDWLPWLQRAELINFYRSHHVMLFPSLHDPGGMVVLESLTQGLPVVCLDIGGPGILVTEDCGRVIEAARSTRAEIIARLGQALVELSDEDTRAPLVPGARWRSDEFCWQSKVARIYGVASRPAAARLAGSLAI